MSGFNLVALGESFGVASVLSTDEIDLLKRSRRARESPKFPMGCPQYRVPIPCRELGLDEK